MRASLAVAIFVSVSLIAGCEKGFVTAACTTASSTSSGSTGSSSATCGAGGAPGFSDAAEPAPSR